VAREGGSVPAVSDAIEMSPGDFRLLFFDFGNLREFWDGGSINPNIAPTVTVSAGSEATFSDITVLPIVKTNASPVGILMSITGPATTQWIGAYYVQFWCNAGNTTGTFNVSVTITLNDGTELTRVGALVIG
jgi:hypothetical protein